MTSLADIAKAQADYDGASNARVAAQSHEYETLATLNALKEKYAREQKAIPGMHILVINEVGLTERVTQIFKDGLQSQAVKVAKEYGLPTPTITTETFVGDASKSPLFDHSLPTIYITNRRPSFTTSTAQAWRWVENGVPVVIVPPQLRPFGKYTKPWVLGGVVKTPARFLSGLISVLAHELSEMIVAPMMDQFTLPDNAGKSWRKEICDPVLGAYFMENINGQDCVFPDFVLPSFWNANGKAPYSYMGTAKAPMVWAKGSYAWFRIALSKLTRVQF